MASLLDIRRRIKSVKNTQQITKAMKMVVRGEAEARAGSRRHGARPFARKMTEVLGGLSAQVATRIFSIRCSTRAATSNI